MDLMTGAGMHLADNTLGFLSALAALITYWNIATRESSRMLMTARWFIAVGWTILAGRIGYAWWVGFDVQIAPTSLFAIALLAAGSILRNIDEGGRAT